MPLRPYVRLLLRVVSTVRNWPAYFLNRYGFLRGPEVRYRLRNGVTVVSRPFRVDGSALNDVWLEESYDPAKAGIAFDWTSCRTVVDVGANIGTFTLYAGWKAPQTQLISVEPEPGNIRMLRTNIAANGLDGRVTVVEAGIAAEKGTAMFFLSGRNSGGNSLFRHKQTTGESLTVALTTLQDVFDANGVTQCDFLKMDCEGGEYDGLYGLKPETLASIRFMAVEYHHFAKGPRHTPDELTAYLRKNGFQVTKTGKSVFFASRV